MNIRNLNYNHLYYFHNIAQAGSIAKASQSLSVTQPTLSQQLRQLEDQLGSELFERRGRSLELNHYGKYLFDYTRQIFGLVEKMMTGFSYNQQIKVSKTFRIGLTPTVSRLFAANLMAPLFSQEDLGVQIIETHYSEAVDRLHSLDLDFIICERPPEHLIAESLVVEDIQKPRYHFICGKKFKTKNIKIPDDLAGAPYFKYPANNSIQKEVDMYFYKKDVYPSVIGESGDLNMVIAATKLNNCFAIAPHIAIEDSIESKELFSLGEFSSSGANICSVYLKENSNDDIKKIMELLSRKS